MVVLTCAVAAACDGSTAPRSLYGTYTLRAIDNVRVPTQSVASGSLVLYSDSTFAEILTLSSGTESASGIITGTGRRDGRDSVVLVDPRSLASAVYGVGYWISGELVLYHGPTAFSAAFKYQHR